MSDITVPQGMWAKMSDLWVVRVPVQLAEPQVTVVRKDGSQSTEKVTLDMAWTDGSSFLYALERDAAKFAELRPL